jgi:hypothetical protein
VPAYKFNPPPPYNSRQWRITAEVQNSNREATADLSVIAGGNIGNHKNEPKYLYEDRYHVETEENIQQKPKKTYEFWTDMKYDFN